jgi:hypothetical protein
MTELREELVDIPEPDRALAPRDRDPSAFDPGTEPPPPPAPLGLGEDPAYDPGGLGFQPDIAEDAEDHR